MGVPSVSSTLCSPDPCAESGGLSGRDAEALPFQAMGILPRNRGGLPQRSLPKLIFMD